MNFESKEDLIAFIEHQCGITLSNEECFCNSEHDLLYTEIPKSCKNEVLRILDKYGIRHNQHLKDYYFIYLVN